MAARLQTVLQRSRQDLFVPLAFALSRRIEQVAWDELADDPGLGAFALKSAQKNFLADGVINWADGWLEAESVGLACKRDADGSVAVAPAPLEAAPDTQAMLQSQPVRCAIDIATRLCQQAGDQGLVFGYLTGPATVQRRLFGPLPRDARTAADASGRIAMALAKAYCEAGVSALLLAEEEPVADAAMIEALNPMFNLADYYGAAVIYVSRQPLPADAAAALTGLGARIAGAQDAEHEIIALPIGEASVEECAAQWRSRTVSGKPRLVVSSWDIRADTAPEDVIGVAKKIKQI
jgi:hypothetical protein